MTIHKNDPSLWKHLLPASREGGHKYDRGIAVIYGAPDMTGATRLAAESCARMGAGIVRVIAPKGMGTVYRSTLPAHIIVDDETADISKTEELLKDKHCRAFLMGPGCPPEDMYKRLFGVAAAQRHLNGIVLDAGAFLSWAGAVPEFKANVGSCPVIVTPHDGEFKKFFGDTISVVDKTAMAEDASRRLNATVVLKGAVTVIADREGTIVQERDIPALSTAGTGDVLAGMIAGLIAQGMNARDSSAAAAWIHAEAGAKFGAGLVASDLPDIIPAVLKELC